MATTTARRRSSHPMRYYWDMVKDMDDSQKLELVTMLIESVKPKLGEEMTIEKMLEEYPHERYTMEDINAMLEEAEADIAAGRVIDDDTLWKEDEEEYEQELAEERRLQLETV